MSCRREAWFVLIFSVLLLRMDTHGSPKCLLSELSGAMIAMSPSVTLKGSVKFSMKKMLVGGEMSTSTYTGPGEVLLAPSMLGDISVLRLNGSETWSVGKDGFLASTQGVVKDYKNQGLGKAFFSGEGLFVYKISGTGLLFVESFGAIIRKDVRFPLLLVPSFAFNVEDLC